MSENLTAVSDGTATETKIDADLWWLRIMRDLIGNGTWKEMRPYAASIYVVVKSYANGKTGECSHSQERLAELAGMSLSEAKRALGKLVELGLLKVRRVGRNRRYTAVEQVSLRVQDDEVAKATWPYIPMTSEAGFVKLSALSRQRAYRRPVSW